MHKGSITHITVVGLGITGAIVALRAYQRGYNVQIYDTERGATASRAAAGLLNPIAGKRFVKAWLADITFPVAWEFYAQAEEMLNTTFAQKIPIVRYFENSEQHADAERRFHAYPPLQVELLRATEEFPLGGIKVLDGGRVDVHTFLNAVTNFFSGKDCLRSERLPQNYTPAQHEVVIWCEGKAVVQNPLWQHFPFTATKGETIELEHASLQQNQIRKDETALVPIGAGRAFLGAQYQRDYSHELPTKEALAVLQADLQQYTNATITQEAIVCQRAGVRIAGYDMMPVLGEHPSRSRHYICNGLTSKALSLMPYLSSCLLDAIEGKAELAHQIRLSRLAERLAKKQ